MLKDIKYITEICYIEKNTILLRIHFFGNTIFFIMENNIIMNYG